MCETEDRECGSRGEGRGDDPRPASPDRLGQGGATGALHGENFAVSGGPVNAVVDTQPKEHGGESDSDSCHSTQSDPQTSGGEEEADDERDEGDQRDADRSERRDEEQSAADRRAGDAPTKVASQEALVLRRIERSTDGLILQGEAGFPAQTLERLVENGSKSSPTLGIDLRTGRCGDEKGRAAVL